MLTMKGIHHQKVMSTACTYIRAKEGAGLLALRTHTIKFLLKFALSPKLMLPELTDDNRHKFVRKKPLHGKFFHQQEEILQVELAQSYQWLRCTQLCPETKAAICAAQEQTM
eukprot:538902-Ditylum_brightwellii.AAC.1